MTNIDHRNILAGLEEFSDLEYQQRLWTGSIYGKGSDFVEGYHKIFGDSALDVALATTDGPIYRDDIDRDLVRLDKILVDFDIDRSYREMLDDPEMTAIAELAGSILDRLRPLDLPNGMAPGPALAPLESGSGRNP